MRWLRYVAHPPQTLPGRWRRFRDTQRAADLREVRRLEGRSEGLKQPSAASIAGASRLR
jgi:hypothetical protein